MTSSSRTQPKRPIRSYVIRSRRLTLSQQRAIDQHWQDYVVDYRPGLLPWTELFPGKTGLTVEIGCGMGDSLLEMALAQPELAFLGIEVRRKRIGMALRRIAAQQPNNLKLMCHDAREVLENTFEPNAISRILILFPDPWPKRRHHKRRLIQPDFARLLHARLKPGGTLHLATDWEAYASQMLEVLEDVEGLENKAGAGRYREARERLETLFSRRARGLGLEVRELLFVKRDG